MEYGRNGEVWKEEWGNVLGLEVWGEVWGCGERFAEVCWLLGCGKMWGEDPTLPTSLLTSPIPQHTSLTLLHTSPTLLHSSPHFPTPSMFPPYLTQLPKLPKIPRFPHYPYSFKLS